MYIVPMVLIAEYSVGTGFFLLFWMCMYLTVLIAEFPVGTGFFFSFFESIFFLLFL